MLLAAVECTTTDILWLDLELHNNPIMVHLGVWEWVANCNKHYILQITRSEHTRYTVVVFL